MVAVWVAELHGLTLVESTQLCILFPGKGDQPDKQCQTQLQAPSALCVHWFWDALRCPVLTPISSCPFPGEALGISSGKMEVANGSAFSEQVGSHTLSRITMGTVLGLLFGLLFLGGILFLHRKGKLR